VLKYFNGIKEIIGEEKRKACSHALLKTALETIGKNESQSQAQEDFKEMFEEEIALGRNILKAVRKKEIPQEQWQSVALETTNSPISHRAYKEAYTGYDTFKIVKE
jgi:hypothetical protein